MAGNLELEGLLRIPGRKGNLGGAWTAYVCQEEYRGGANIPLLFQVLYVKK